MGSHFNVAVIILNHPNSASIIYISGADPDFFGVAIIIENISQSNIWI
jgi:hypothetical protein